MKRFGFSKAQRLLSNAHFRTVLAERRCARDDLLTLYVRANDCAHARLGISISRTCGDAVTRNRLKRLLREVFRRRRQAVPNGLDCVVMISPRLSRQLRDAPRRRKALRDVTFDRLQSSFLYLVRKVAEADG